MYRPLPEQLHPIDTIPPSSIGGVLQGDGCRFSAVLGSRGNRGESRGLPLSGRTIMGTVVHNLLDYARRRGRQWATALQEWDELIDSQEIRLADNPLDSHLIPLSSMKGYQTERLSTSFRAEGIRSGMPPSDNGDDTPSAHPHRMFGPEVRVWDVPTSPPAEGPPIGETRISGTIDLVSPLGAEVVIRDYKTGQILEDGEPKMVYQTQLRLYAAMYKATADSLEMGLPFPTSAVLERVTSGECHQIDIDENYCMELLESAQDCHIEINEIVNQDSSCQAVCDALANPTPDNCYYCQYRTGCPAYANQLPQWMVDDAEIHDVMGELETLPTPEAPGSPFVTMVIIDTQGNRWRVNRIDSNANRNSVLGELQEGDDIGVFACHIVENTQGPLGVHRIVLPELRNHVVYRRQ